MSFAIVILVLLLAITTAAAIAMTVLYTRQRGTLGEEIDIDCGTSPDSQHLIENRYIKSLKVTCPAATAVA